MVKSFILLGVIACILILGIISVYPLREIFAIWLYLIPVPIIAICTFVISVRSALKGELGKAAGVCLLFSILLIALGAVGKNLLQGYWLQNPDYRGFFYENPFYGQPRFYDPHYGRSDLN